jgi:hypothetical protein
MYIYCTKEDDGLTEGAYCSCTAGYELCACFLFSVSCLCSANSGPLDNNKGLQPIMAEMFLANSWQHVVVTMVSLNESVHFNNVWEMSVQISLEANDLRTY